MLTIISFSGSNIDHRGLALALPGVMHLGLMFAWHPDAIQQAVAISMQTAR